MNYKNNICLLFTYLIAGKLKTLVNLKVTLFLAVKADLATFDEMREHELSHQLELLKKHGAPILAIWDSNPFKSKHPEDYDNEERSKAIERFTTQTEFDPLFDYIF